MKSILVSDKIFDALVFSLLDEGHSRLIKNDGSELDLGNVSVRRRSDRSNIVPRVIGLDEFSMRCLKVIMNHREHSPIADGNDNNDVVDLTGVYVVPSNYNKHDENHTFEKVSDLVTTFAKETREENLRLTNIMKVDNRRLRKEEIEDESKKTD